MWAPAALALWLTALAGALVLPSHFDALAWHRHEMLFGFVGAVIAGFLLAAIPNWTRRPPIGGKPLVTLFGLWAAARLALLFSAELGAAPAALLDVGFFLVLALVGANEVLQANNRNMPIVGMVLLFGIACGLDHAGAAGLLENTDLGWVLALSLVLLMISLLGGRIIPAFTRNWMTKRGLTSGLPAKPARFDLFVIVVTAVALFAWMTAPPGLLTGGLLVAAGLLHFIRLARWGGLRTATDPLVLILHVGYAWLPLGLVLLGLSLLGDVVPRSAAIHALTSGAMATMILAVMTRATLGHTGRELRANAATVAIYILVTCGALLRVAAPLGFGEYTLLMQASAILWGGAFLAFLSTYGPILLAARLGESE